MSLLEPALRVRLGVLYADHQSWLTGWLTRRVGCTHRAADLTQDTFERVLRRDDIADIQEPRPWLLTIAKRLLIDKSRRHALEQAYFEGCLVLAQADPLSAPSAEQIQMAVQMLEKVAMALETLSEKARRAFVLRHIDGLTLAEIATELSVSHAMVSKYLVQALIACDDVLDDSAP